MAAYETGYEDELFEHPVSQSLHCCICTKVIKDAVACRRNEHLFCRPCITKRLKNYQTCPSCREPLTVDTLSQAPRTVKKLLAELKIRCKFFDRGCGEFFELGTLRSHIRKCGFAPAVCSNEGCQLEVNKRDLLHHETAVCKQRRVKCHSCNDIKQEMDIVKVNLAAINVKIDKNHDNLKRIREKVGNNEATFAVVENVVENVELVQDQLKKQEESNRRLEADNVEMKRSLNEMTKQLKRIRQEISRDVHAEHKRMKKDGRDSMVVIAGGKNKSGSLNSVEMFSLSNETWTPLQPMRESRSGASSVVYMNQFIVMGGLDSSKNGKIKNMETLSVNAVDADQSITWENFPAKLHEYLAHHCSVVYNGRLIVIGGDGDDYTSSRNITEISLVPPYSSKVLATLPDQLSWYRYLNAVLFDDNIVIVIHHFGCTDVLMYNVTENVCKRLRGLPYIVREMAMIKWNDNFVLLGGADKRSRPLSKVLLYNIDSQKSYMLPEMRYKRSGCVAVVVRDTVIVMGGKDEAGNYLKSVECFRFDRFTWEELPDMHEERYQATGAIS